MIPFVNHLLRGDLDEALERYEKAADARRTAVRVVVLRNVTAEPLVPYLRYHGYGSGLDIEARLGGYDAIVADVNDANGECYAFDPEVIIVIARLCALSPMLWSGFNGASQSEITEEVGRVTGAIRSIVFSIRGRSDATVLVNNFEIPLYPAGGIFDVQRRDGQVQTIRRLNMNLTDVSRDAAGVYIVDMELLQARAGGHAFTDSRYWHIGRVPYTPLGWDLLAAEYLKYIRALKGKAKKCLALDCDNTLWGGVVGEAGINGIALDETYPGSCFTAFQKAIRELHDRGVILALCSKNNESDVLEVLDRHPHSALRREHFAARAINWNDKPSNLKALAEELRLGLDSFVFVDDSAAEIDFMRRELPSVACLALPNDPAEYRDLLLSCGLFDAPALSEEDRRRTQLYAQEAARNSARASFTPTDNAGYCSSLGLEAAVGLADDFAVPRVAQLTQKTNQFNLTTRRYGEAEIQKLAASPDSEVLYLSLRDKFGESGIVGVCILVFSETSARIDTLLVSCRVIGRDADAVLLKAALDRCIRRCAVTTIVGRYRPTAKNEQVRDFYLRKGFQSRGVDGDAAEFEIDRDSAAALRYPAQYRSIVAFGSPINLA